MMELIMNKSKNITEILWQVYVAILREREKGGEELHDHVGNYKERVSIW